MTELTDWGRRYRDIMGGPGTLYARLQAVAALGESPDPRCMSARHVLALFDHFPKLYREAWSETSPRSPIARDSIDLGVGWLGIIERLSAKLAENPNIFVVQMKEKFGTLVAYVANELWEIHRGKPEGTIDAVIYQARHESASTCELCGQPGGMLLISPAAVAAGALSTPDQTTSVKRRRSSSTAVARPATLRPGATRSSPDAVVEDEAFEAHGAPAGAGAGITNGKGDSERVGGEPRGTGAPRGGAVKPPAGAPRAGTPARRPPPRPRKKGKRR